MLEKLVALLEMNMTIVNLFNLLTIRYLSKLSLLYHQ